MKGVRLQFPFAKIYMHGRYLGALLLLPLPLLLLLLRLLPLRLLLLVTI